MTRNEERSGGGVTYLLYVHVAYSEIGYSVGYVNATIGQCLLSNPIWFLGTVEYCLIELGKPSTKRLQRC